MPIPLPSGVVAIVDDDAALRRALERSLLAQGYRVQAYASAEEFMRESNAMEISCVVLDIDLGAGLSGFELGYIISRSLHATPIVFMSGSTTPTSRALAEEMGCVDFLRKPFLVENLVEALGKCAARHSPFPGAGSL